MFTVFVVLVILAGVLTILAAMGKVPLWAAVANLWVIELLRILPLGKS